MAGCSLDAAAPHTLSVSLAPEIVARIEEDLGTE